MGKKASAKIIRRILRKYNFQDQTARDKTSTKEHLHKDLDYWKSVIYADESKYL